jgi:hypothetical protein
MRNFFLIVWWTAVTFWFVKMINHFIQTYRRTGKFNVLAK